MTTNVFAAERVVNLVVSYKTVHFAGKPRQAICVNNSIPAPTLRFQQGDHVTIHVYNHLDRATAIHWHGIILPWQMDGVQGVTQEGIPPGGVFHYRFTLHQSGTYWYHAHAGLQEQQGLYGAFIVDPTASPPYHYNKDFNVILSDWSNTDPEDIEANLKKMGDFYSPLLPLQPSLAKFIHDYRSATPQEQKLLIADYKMMQQMRMSIYDFSDVAYDAFLLNGHPSCDPWKRLVKVGDTVRLRFINAAGASIFHVKIPNVSMQIVHVQGNDVKPYSVTHFTIAPGETVDALIKIQQQQPYSIYAESIDTKGAAIGGLITSPKQCISLQAVKSFPEPANVMRSMMANMNHAMHGEMDMPTESAIIGDRFYPPNTHYQASKKNQYQNMTASVKTNDPHKPVDHVIKMELFGYMERFIWFINGVPEYNAKPIRFEPGKRYRFIFINTSMMRHPMHIHGHWFIFRNGHGAYDPLLHTINVNPGATLVADVDADVSGQWLFHCHLLYHMMSGMARIFQYSTLIDEIRCDAPAQNNIKSSGYHNRPIVHVDAIRPINLHEVQHPMAHEMQMRFATWLDIGEDAYHNTQKINFKALYGYDYNKLELYTDDAEVSNGHIENADVDIFYWHLISQFWAIKGGVNYTYRPALSPYWQPGIGLEGVMPYFIDTNLRAYYYHGALKFDLELERDTQITNNFFIRTAIRSILATKSLPEAELSSGLNQMRYVVRPYYRMTTNLNLFVEYENEHIYGRFKQEDKSSDNTFTLGIAMLF